MLGAAAPSHHHTTGTKGAASRRGNRDAHHSRCPTSIPFVAPILYTNNLPVHLLGLPCRDPQRHRLRPSAQLLRRACGRCPPKLHSSVGRPAPIDAGSGDFLPHMASKTAEYNSVRFRQFLSLCNFIKLGMNSTVS